MPSPRPHRRPSRPHLSGTPTGRSEGPLGRVLYRSGLVTVGTFRAGVEHPRFHDSGPIERPIFVFPRTSVAIRHAGRDPFAADTSTITYYNRGQRYTRRPIDPRGDLCEWFSVRAGVLREVIARHDPAVEERGRRVFAFTHGPSDPGSYLLQRLVVRHLMTAEEPDRLAVDETVLEILERVVALACASGPSRTDDPAPDRPGSFVPGAVKEHLRDSFTEGDSLDEIASAAGISVSHMCREFRKRTGTTIHRYRTQLRLRRSLELVADSRSDLGRIAHRLGFSSHSHFTASFHRGFGLTPSRFRERASSRRIRTLTEKLARTDPVRAWEGGRAVAGG